MSHHRNMDQQGAIDLLNSVGRKNNIPDLSKDYYEADNTDDAMEYLRQAVNRVYPVKKASGGLAYAGGGPIHRHGPLTKYLHGGLALAGY
jgi:hypothetical protein